MIEQELLKNILLWEHEKAPELAMLLVKGIDLEDRYWKNSLRFAKRVIPRAIKDCQNENNSPIPMYRFLTTAWEGDVKAGGENMKDLALIYILYSLYPDSYQEVETLEVFNPEETDERILTTQREFNFYEILKCFRKGSVNGQMNYNELNKGFELLETYNDIELYDRLLEGCALDNYPCWPEKWIHEYKIAEDSGEFHRPAEIMNRLVLTAPDGTNIDSSFTEDNLLEFYINHISLSINSIVPINDSFGLHNSIFGFDEHYWEILSNQTPLSFFTNFSFLIHLMNIEITDDHRYREKIYRRKYKSQFMEESNTPSFHFLDNFLKSPVAIKMKDFWKPKDSVMIRAVNMNSYFKMFISEELKRNLVFDTENRKHYDKRFKEIYDSINLVKKSGNILNTLSTEFRNNEEIVKAAVKQNGLSLKYASEALKADKTIVEAAMNQDIMAFKYAGSSLKNNKEFVSSLLKHDGTLIQFISPEMQNDKEIVLIAIKQNIEVIKGISEQLKNDKEFVLSLLNINGMLLEFASDELKNDVELATIAVKQNFDAIKYISDTLKNNSAFMLELILENKEVLNHIAAELRKDATFCVEVMKALSLKNIPDVFDSALNEKEEVKALIPMGGVLTTEYIGTVKFFSYFKGMGFIIEDKTKKEYYTDIQSIIDRLETGDKVKFKLKKTDQGMSATNVRLK